MGTFKQAQMTKLGTKVIVKLDCKLQRVYIGIYLLDYRQLDRIYPGYTYLVHFV